MWSSVWMKCTVTWTVILAATWRLRMIRDEYWTWWKSDWPFSSTPTILYCSCTAPRLPYSLSMSSVTCSIGDNSLTAAQIFEPINWQKIYYTTRLHPFNGLFSRTTWSKRWWGGSGISCTICKSFATRFRQYTSTSPLSFLQARCPFCHPTNSVKALKICLHKKQFLVINHHDKD